MASTAIMQQIRNHAAQSCQLGPVDNTSRAPLRRDDPGPFQRGQVKRGARRSRRHMRADIPSTRALGTTPDQVADDTQPRLL